MGRPFLTGRIHYTPEAEQQLNQLDEWITEKASVDIARRFVSAIMAHCEGTSSDELVVNILGIFHGGQDWEAALGQDQIDPEAGR